MSICYRDKEIVFVQEKLSLMSTSNFELNLGIVLPFSDISAEIVHIAGAYSRRFFRAHGKFQESCCLVSGDC